MKTIPERFTKYGEQFEQVCRTGDKAIYLRHRNGRQKSYEVIVIRVANRKPSKAHGRPKFAACEPYECYPSSEKWGTSAWTCTTEARARRRYEQLQYPGESFARPRPNSTDGFVADGFLQDCALAVPRINTASCVSQRPVQNPVRRAAAAPILVEPNRRGFRTSASKKGVSAAVET